MAQQLEFFDIPSPCRGICQADERGYCRGCLRSRDERFGWMKMTDTEKRSCIQCVDSGSNVILVFNESADAPVVHFG